MSVVEGAEGLGLSCLVLVGDSDGELDDVEGVLFGARVGPDTRESGGCSAQFVVALVLDLVVNAFRERLGGVKRVVLGRKLARQGLDRLVHEELIANLELGRDHICNVEQLGALGGGAGLGSEGVGGGQGNAHGRGHGQGDAGGDDLLDIAHNFNPLT